jgi:transcriptional regulator with XRE-family HTH domain
MAGEMRRTEATAPGAGAQEGAARARQPEVRVGLRTARERQGLILREVARRTGLSPSFLSQLERDRVSPVHRLAEAVRHRPGEREGELLADPVPEGLVLRRAERPAWRLHEGRYTPGEIDRLWSAAIEADFAAWRKEREGT